MAQTVVVHMIFAVVRTRLLFDKILELNQILYTERFGMSTRRIEQLPLKLMD